MSSGRIPSVEGGIQPTILDAKGDLIVATAADTPARLAVGSANQVLTVDSSTATGLKWATPAAGGKVLQVVQATAVSNVTNSTDTYADTGLSASITPSATSSKILVFVAQNQIRKSDGNSGNRLDLRLLRDSTVVQVVADLLWTNTTVFATCSASMIYLDSPNTTSAITYKTQFRNAINAASVSVQPSGGTNPASITLMEIGA